MLEKDYMACQVIYNELKASAPKDTWNLTLKGIRIVQHTLGYEIRVGGETATYGVDLNEKGIHKGWVDEAVARCKPLIKNIMSGAMSYEEIEQYNLVNKLKIKDQFSEAVARKKRDLSDI